MYLTANQLSAHVPFVAMPISTCQLAEHKDGVLLSGQMLPRASWMVFNGPSFKPKIRGAKTHQLQDHTIFCHVSNSTNHHAIRSLVIVAVVTESTQGTIHIENIGNLAIYLSGDLCFYPYLH